MATSTPDGLTSILDPYSTDDKVALYDRNVKDEDCNMHCAWARSFDCPR